MKKTRSISVCALFAVICAIMSWVAIPTPLGVPVTLQTLAVALTGFMLGAKRGTTVVALYLLLGAAGLPVFSSLQGGIGVLSSANGGFLWGFLFLAFFCGISEKAYLSFIGLLLCHAAGVVQFSLISGVGFPQAFLTASLPFIIKDILMILAAKYIAGRIKLEDIYD